MLLSRFCLIISSLVSVSLASTYCNTSSSCPESLPCCSQYGECGTGAYCLGGCHPLYSYSLDACMPMPICKNSSTSFTDVSSFVSTDDYLGDPDDGDWVYSGYVVDYDDSSILAMPNQTSGTVLSSSRYVWYGHVSATLKTSRGTGIVTAFILFSNAQDEIDWEFVGYNLTSAESNFYYQGVLNYTNVLDIDVENSTFENYHTYEVDWTEDQLTWYLDGEEVRVLNKEDTYNATDDTYYYPQTPARVQFSLWPAGDSTATGTIEWAGGEVDWDSEDVEEYGYFYMILKEASIVCYDPPSGTFVNGTTAYVFNNTDDYNEDYVMITDDGTVLGSSDATGLDPDEGASSSSSSSSSKSSSTKSSTSTSTSTDEDDSTATTSDDSTETTAATDDSTTKATSTTTVPTGFVQFASASTSVNSSNDAIAIGANGPITSFIIGFIALLII